ncbi:MAG: helix-turn-helix domain-containing protein [Acetobacteraceae bacterium]|nr:helix-turn-helix domain-containing protein [Acetobacteraceae bacterium]
MPTDVIAYQPKDAARVLGIGLTKLYELIGAGDLPAKKAGGRTLIPADALRSYVDNLPAASIRTGQPVKPDEARRRPRAASRRAA